MTRCKHCNVIVDSQHPQCPLCSRVLENSGQSITQYPNYKKVYYQMNNFSVTKIFLFLTISVIVILLTINLLTIQHYACLWSLIPITCLLYVWITYRKVILSNSHLGSKILIEFFSLSVLLLVIDICSGFSKWSTTYIIPFLSIALTLLLSIFAARKSHWQEYMGYLLATFFISLSSFILFIFHLSSVVWTSVTAIVYTLLTVIGLIIFSDRKFKEEMKRRFHL
ncbi:MAG TPA: DUF6320 domain-containing protein [Oscillospiraceae bacterium]|nr:DUF6320 domain-containing protein [Oscillospiraceae bacterium]